MLSAVLSPSFLEQQHAPTPGVCGGYFVLKLNTKTLNSHAVVSQSKGLDGFLTSTVDADVGETIKCRLLLSMALAQRTESERITR